jgi:hypothetical protein
MEFMGGDRVPAVAPGPSELGRGGLVRYLLDPLAYPNADVVAADADREMVL